MINSNAWPYPILKIHLLSHVNKFYLWGEPRPDFVTKYVVMFVTVISSLSLGDIFLQFWWCLFELSLMCMLFANKS